MFKVPEANRVRGGQMGSDITYGKNGAFAIPSIIPGRVLWIVASDGSTWKEEGLPGVPWEHVSVHVVQGKNKAIPTWVEMCQAKSIFWDDDDVVIQFHPAKADHVNTHAQTLHLWRPVGVEIPLPPIITV